MVYVDRDGLKYLLDKRDAQESREKALSKKKGPVKPKRRRRSSREESYIQKQLVKYIRMAYPRTLMTISPSIFSMLPGLDKLHRIIIVNELRAMGYRDGTSDLLIDVSRGKYPGMRLEIKTEAVRSEKGKGLSQDQKDYIRDAIKEGFFARVAWGFDEAKKWIDWYLKLEGKK